MKLDPRCSNQCSLLLTGLPSYFHQRLDLSINDVTIVFPGLRGSLGIRQGWYGSTLQYLYDDKVTDSPISFLNVLLSNSHHGV